MNSLNSNYLHIYDEDGLTLDKLREFVEVTKDKDGNIKVYINSNKIISIYKAFEFYSKVFFILKFVAKIVEMNIYL